MLGTACLRLLCQVHRTLQASQGLSMNSCRIPLSMALVPGARSLMHPYQWGSAVSTCRCVSRSWPWAKAGSWGSRLSPVKTSLIYGVHTKVPLLGLHCLVRSQQARPQSHSDAAGIPCWLDSDRLWSAQGAPGSRPRGQTGIGGKVEVVASTLPLLFAHTSCMGSSMTGPPLASRDFSKT